MGICGVAVLAIFLCGVAVNKILFCAVAVISKPAVCDVCVFKPTVFGETNYVRCCGFLFDTCQS